MDVTEWLSQHPGGGKLLLSHCGRDASKVFRALKHSDGARRMAEQFVVGRLASAAPVQLRARL